MKLALLWPDATVTLAGTVSNPLLLTSETVAALFSAGVGVAQLLKDAHPVLAVAAAIGKSVKAKDVERVVHVATRARAWAQEPRILNGMLGDPLNSVPAIIK